VDFRDLKTHMRLKRHRRAGELTSSAFDLRTGIGPWKMQEIAIIMADVSYIFDLYPQPDVIDPKDSGNSGRVAQAHPKSSIKLQTTLCMRQITLRIIHLRNNSIHPAQLHCLVVRQNIHSRDSNIQPLSRMVNSQDENALTIIPVSCQSNPNTSCNTTRQYLRNTIALSARRRVPACDV
jgi:hypothetical protein